MAALSHGWPIRGSVAGACQAGPVVRGRDGCHLVFENDRPVAVIYAEALPPLESFCRGFQTRS